MFSSKYGKCQSGSISATPSAEMNSVEMTFAIAVIPSGQVVSACRPAQHPKLIGRRRSVLTQSRHSGLVVMQFGRSRGGWRAPGHDGSSVKVADHYGHAAVP